MTSIIFVGDEFNHLPHQLESMLNLEEFQAHFFSTEGAALSELIETYLPTWVVVSEGYFRQFNSAQPLLVGGSLDAASFPLEDEESTVINMVDLYDAKPQKPSFLKTKAKELSQKEHHHVHEHGVVRHLDLLKRQGSLDKTNILLYLEKLPSQEVMRQYFRAGVVDFLTDVEQLDTLTNRLLVAIRQQKKCYQSRELAEQVNLLNKDLYARSMQMEAELEKTRKLQHSLLPLALERAGDEVQFNPFAFTKVHFETEHLRITGLYLPCDALGGDLYDLINFNDGTLGVVVSDVSGHGVPAAFVTAMFKSVFYRTTHAHQTPDQVLYHINNQMAAIVKTGDYLTAVYMRFDPAGKWVQYGGAGHPYPILYRGQDNTVELLEENGMPLVWVPDMDYNMKEVALKSGDYLLLYTDGVTELANTQEELFGEERLCELLKSAVTSPTGMCDEVLDDILMCLSNFTEGQPLNDDMTMLLVQVK
jgi:serine phosphatase RsbU (regulator of sigma subunit)